MTTNPIFTIASFILLLFVMYSCSSDLRIVDNPTQAQETNDSKVFNLVDEKLWPYFESFEIEAAQRNIRVDLNASQITGVIENISETGVAGTCQYGQHIHHVTIDKPFWNRASNLLREMVVYHELGHCVLARGHTEDEDTNGSCLSIMNSGTTDCIVRYNLSNKEYYLDELFQ